MVKAPVLAPDDDDLEEGEIRAERESSHEEVRRPKRLFASPLLHITLQI